jgi:hypothetical protein
MELDIKDFSPPRSSDVDISEIVAVQWVKLDRLMRLPIIDTHCVSGRPGLVGVNSRQGYCITVDEQGIPLSDYIDSLGIGFASGGFRILVRAYQTIDPEYQPERRFRIIVVVHLEDRQGLQFAARAGIAGPSMVAIMGYLESL